MMGIMVPETCWANNKFSNKEPSVASSWSFYIHVLTTMHGQTHIRFHWICYFYRSRVYIFLRNCVTYGTLYRGRWLLTFGKNALPVALGWRWRWRQQVSRNSGNHNPEDHNKLIITSVKSQNITLSKKKFLCRRLFIASCRNDGKIGNVRVA